jgi:exodeoxyribonuclease VII large subunit
MDRFLTWDESRSEVVVTFHYDTALKDWVKSLPSARFGAAERAWRLSRSAMSVALPKLRERGFVWRGPHPFESQDASVSPQSELVTDRPAGLTVGQLRAQAAEALQVKFGNSVWLVAMLAGFRPSGQARWQFLELVDADEAPGTNRASVQGALWGDAVGRVTRDLEAAGLTLADGLKVRVRGRVVLGRRSEVQFYIEEIDVRYSLGELTLKREQILKALADENLLEVNRRLAMPLVPLRVAVLTSANSDAFEDVRKTLSESSYPFELWLFDVRVQGDELAPGVLRSLALVSENASRFDVCLIVRGGGSRTELGAWDDLEVARAVARLPVKVVVGIGHERDRSVLDELAYSCKTPTHAASVLVEQVRDWHFRMESAAERIQQVALTQMSQRRDALLRSAQTLDNYARRLIAVQRARVIDTTPSRIARAIESRWHRERAGLENAARVVRHAAPSRAQDLARSLHSQELRLVRQGERRLADGAQRLEFLKERMSRAADARVREASQALAYAASMVRSADPQRVLERGFALIESTDGRPVSRAAQVHEKMMLSIRMVDGTLHARVEDRTVHDCKEGTDDETDR